MPTGRIDIVAPAGFRIVRTLGRGGSGTVYEAHHGSTGRALALKVLDVEGPDDEALRRFYRERGVMADLATHPGIVSIVDAGVHAGRPWIAMDLCRRGSLAGVGSLPLDGVLTVLHAVAGALAVAHERGVIHCDVKPANILVTDYGQPALGDFGVARLALGEGSGSTVGGYTLDHVAPEIVEGCHPSGHADVFSLGTTAWQLLAGRPPYRRPGDPLGAVLARLRNEPLPPLPRGGVPPELVALLHRMTAKHPSDRPSAGALADEVARIAHAHGLSLHRPLAELLPMTTHVPAATGPSPRTASTSQPGTSARHPVGPVPEPGTDHRSDLAQLTHAGRAAALAAPPPSLPAVDGPRRRDPVVVLALIAVVVVVVACGGLVTSRLVPTSNPAQVVTSASGDLQIVPDMGIPSAPGVPLAPALVAAEAANTPAAFGPGGGPTAASGAGTPPAAARPSGGAGPRTSAPARNGATSPTRTQVDPPFDIGRATLFIAHECTGPSRSQCDLPANAAIRTEVGLTDGPAWTTCSVSYTVVGPTGTALRVRNASCDQATRALQTTPVAGAYTVTGEAVINGRTVTNQHSFSFVDETYDPYGG